MYYTTNCKVDDEKKNIKHFYNNNDSPRYGKSTGPNSKRGGGVRSPHPVHSCTLTPACHVRSPVATRFIRSRVGCSVRAPHASEVRSDIAGGGGSRACACESLSRRPAAAAMSFENHGPCHPNFRRAVFVFIVHACDQAHAYTHKHSYNHTLAHINTHTHTHE